MKKIAYYLVTLLCITCISSGVAFAKETQTSTDKVLRVGYIPAPPFVIVKPNKVTGIAIHMWEKIAKSLDINYVYEPLSINIDQEIEKISKNELDIIIGPIAPSYLRLKKADFTQPYFISSVALILNKHSNFWQMVRESFKEVLGPIFLGCLLILFIYINLYWYFESKKKNDVPRKYWAGVSFLFWVSLLRQRLKMPLTLGGRILSFLWIAFGALLLSTFFSTITSSMTLAKSTTQPITSIDEMKRLKIVVIDGTYPQSVAKANDLVVDVVSTREEAFNKLLNKQVDILLDYEYVASYYIQQHNFSEHLALSPFALKNDFYAFGLQYNNPLRDSLNLEIAKLYEGDTLYKICRNFLSPKDSEHCN